MAINRGDIVLVLVPDTSGTSGKIRPVLVVSSDYNNKRLQDAIVAVITSTTQRAQKEATQVFIEVSTPDGKQSGLLNDSAVKLRALTHHPPELVSQKNRYSDCCADEERQ